MTLIELLAILSNTLKTRNCVQATINNNKKSFSVKK